MIGLVRTMDNLTVFVTVVILLRKSVSGEQEACNSKNSKDFDTFHNTILEINFILSTIPPRECCHKIRYFFPVYQILLKFFKIL